MKADAALRVEFNCEAFIHISKIILSYTVEALVQSQLSENAIGGQILLIRNFGR